MSGAAAAIKAYLSGAATEDEVEGAIHMEAVDHPRAQVAFVSFIDAPSAAGAGAGVLNGGGAGSQASVANSGGTASAGSKRRRATAISAADAGKKRVKRPYHGHCIDVLDRMLPRSCSTGKYLLDSDAKPKDNNGSLTEPQKKMVLRAPTIAARFLSQQPYGAGIMDQKKLASDLKSCGRERGLSKLALRCVHSPAVRRVCPAL